MNRSTRCLAPHLQELWTQVYAIAWGHNAYQDGSPNPKYAHDCAEEAAWEAVTRANGGIAPDTIDAAEQLAPIVAPIMWPRSWENVGERTLLRDLAISTLRKPGVGMPECEMAAKCAIAVWNLLHGGQP